MAKKKLSSDRKRSRPVEKRSKLKTVKRNKLLMGAIVLVIAIVAIAAIYLVYNYVGSDTNGEDGANGNGEETYPIAVIDTSMGTIKVELYDDKAPNTCENFIKYANDGFYSGLVFHRVANLDQSALETHVVQGGGFDGDGNHKEPTYAEIDLEIDPDLTHVNGAIAMARTNDPNSATSQFYICDGAHHILDDEYRQANYGESGYAVFGKVIEGMDIVRNIASVQTTTKNTPEGYPMSDWPTDNVIINSITMQ